MISFAPRRSMSARTALSASWFAWMSETIASTLVENFHEEEPVRRSGRTGRRAVLGEQGVAREGRGPLAPPDLDERARDRANHVVEEAVAPHVERHYIADPRAINRIKG